MNTSHKLQLLFVWFGTRPGYIGGGVVRLLETNKILREYCKYYMITQRETYLWLRKLGLRADCFHFVGGNWAWIATIPALFACLISTILHPHEEKKVDVIYSSTHSFLHVFPSILLKFRYRAKLVVYVTLSPLPRFRGRSYLEYLVLWFDRVVSLFFVRFWGDRVIVVNQVDASELIALGFNKERIYVTKYGVEHEVISKIAEVDREVDGVFLGRIAPAKGVMDLLDAWKDVTRRKPNAKLVLVGPAVQDILSKTKSKVQDLGLIHNVKLTGPLYAQDKYKALKKSKLFLLPSYEDTWSIAISEAMACGCAVIAYDLPTLRAVYGDSILWARTDGKKDLANKITHLLEDETDRIEYACLSMEFASKLDWKAVSLGELRSLEELFLHHTAR